MRYILTFEGFYNIERDATNTNQNYFDDNPMWFGADQTGSADKQVKVEFDSGADPKPKRDVKKKLQKKKAKAEKRRKEKAANMMINFPQFWAKEFEPPKKPVLKRYQ